MTHTAIPSSPGGETDAARGYDAVDRVPHELFIGGGLDSVLAWVAGVRNANGLHHRGGQGQQDQQLFKSAR